MALNLKVYISSSEKPEQCLCVIIGIRSGEQHRFFFQANSRRARAHVTAVSDPRGEYHIKAIILVGSTFSTSELSVCINLKLL